MADTYETLADYVSDSDVTWLSPVGDEDSLEELVSLPRTYLEEDDISYIADVGCGNAQLTAAVADAYPASTVIGVDLYPENVAAGNIIRGDFHNIFTSDLQFDIIYGVNMLQSVSSPGQSLEQLYNHLADSGVLILTLPGVDDGMNAFPEERFTDNESTDLPKVSGQFTLPNREIVEDEQHLFPQERLTSLIEQAGYQIDPGYPQKLAVDTTSLSWWRDAHHAENAFQENTPHVDLYVLQKEQ